MTPKYGLESKTMLVNAVKIVNHKAVTHIQHILDAATENMRNYVLTQIAAQDFWKKVLVVRTNNGEHPHWHSGEYWRGQIHLY